MLIQSALPVDDFLASLLKVGSGLFWTLTYILIIRRGKLDQCHGMPMVALSANLSWEFIFSFIFPHDPPQIYVDYVWLTFDLGILYQYFQFGRKDFPDNISSVLFVPSFLLTLVLSFLAILMMAYEFDDTIGFYAAFAQNFLMSVLFVRMLIKRNSVAGQSLYIALAKMIGTILPCILFYLHFPHSYLLTYLYFAIFTFDWIYIFMIYQFSRRMGINPWKRW
ncbi:MAG: hypothetical protein ACNS62_08470 [Candidatus Cyclobacteriaceae bacterium M3_2C_046]